MISSNTVLISSDLTFSSSKNETSVFAELKMFGFSSVEGVDSGTIIESAPGAPSQLSMSRSTFSTDVFTSVIVLLVSM